MQIMWFSDAISQEHADIDETGMQTVSQYQMEEG